MFQWGGFVNVVRKAQAAAWEDKFKAMKAKQKGSEVNARLVVWHYVDDYDDDVDDVDNDNDCYYDAVDDDCYYDYDYDDYDDDDASMMQKQLPNN